MSVSAAPSSYTDAMTEVKARVSAARTSFHAGMRILPKPRREAMYAFYAFCREVDDIADDGATFEDRRRGLQQWREKISALFKGQASDGITAALLPTVPTYHLVEKDFQDLIDGMEMDAGDPICAPDLKTFDIYCDRVASAVGRVSVRIFGDASDGAMKVAYHLGRALQLTNVLRDLMEDALRSRLYLPKELLEKHGITARDPEEVLRHPHLSAACRELAQQALDHFAQSDFYMRQCVPSAMRPARIMRSYYGTILNLLIADDWRHISKRIALPKWKKLWLVLRALIS